MWSESDSQYSQWALNPSAYQNVSHEQVDWGALAQRWIQMKDTCPPRVPDLPPPPPISLEHDDKKNTDIEGGEAPMDMDKEEVSVSSSVQDSPAWGSWNNWPTQQWSGWGWGAGGVGPPGGVPPPSPAALIGKQSGSLPIPGFSYNAAAAPGFVPPAPGMFNYGQGPPGSGSDFNRAMMGDYWNAGSHANHSGNAALGQGPVPFIRNNRPYWAKRNNRNDHSHSADNSEEEAEEDDLSISLDAAKRRQLPAWIREGLEKMEREKQKKIDRDRQIKEREIYLQKKREEEDALNELQNSSGQPMIPKKSKFDTDSDESDNNEEPALLPSSSKRKSRFRNADSPSSTPQRAVVKEPSPEPRLLKSKEEIRKETEQKLRSMLVAILLEVTTEEMEAVAQEAITKALKKAPATQLRKTPALASLTGKLGLGIYGDSDDSNSGDESDGRDSDNQTDSDEELKDRIERRKNEFAKTEREIEARLQEEEEKENRMVGEVSGDSDGEERQVVNNQSDKRPKAADGIKIKEEPEDIPRHQLEYSKHEETFHVANKQYFNPLVVKKEIKYEHITGRRSDKKGVQVAQAVKPLQKIKQERLSSDEGEEATSKSDSDSSSSSKSSSSAVKASSPEIRRSSKKRSKNGRLREQNDKSSDRKKGSYSLVVKQKKSNEKLSDKSKEKKHVLESKERKEKKKDKRDRSRSKESRRSRRSPSKESRRSKRSPSRESRLSKSSRRNGDILSRKDSDRYRHYSSSTRGSHKSRKSTSKERFFSKRRDSNKSAHKSRESSSKEEHRRSRRSRSPEKEKRKRRESERSHSSRSVSGKGGRYSRSRSSSTPPPRKKSSRQRRSSSSERSSRATGKTAGH